MPMNEMRRNRSFIKQQLFVSKNTGGQKQKKKVKKPGVLYFLFFHWLIQLPFEPTGLS